MMRVRLLSLCLVLVACISSCRRERVTGPPKAVAVRDDAMLELRLMSFNVRYENTGDWGARAWRQRVIGAVHMIRREHSDIIGVQEALHGQAADLWASLPEYEFFGIGRDDGKRTGEYSGIFYQKGRFRADSEDQGTFWLSDTPEKPGSRTWGNEIPRVATWMRLIDLATMRGFYIFNTHWDHQNQPSRERAALLIAQRIDNRRHPHEPVALIGDFNSLLSNPGIAYLTGKNISLAGASHAWPPGLQESYQFLNPQEKNRRTLHFWSDTREGNLKVDHILVSRSAKIESAEILSTDKPMVSDHFPVTARVIFPQTR